MSKVGKWWKPCYPDVCADQLSLASQPIPEVDISGSCNFSLCSHLCNSTETSSCSSLSCIWQIFRAPSLSFAKITGLRYLHDTLGKGIFMSSLSLGAKIQQNWPLNGEQKHTNDLSVFSWFCAGMHCSTRLQYIFYWDTRFSFYDIVTSLRNSTSLNLPMWHLHQHAS